MFVLRVSWNYIFFFSFDYLVRVKKILEKCECFFWFNKWRYDLVFNDDDEYNSKFENKRKK